MKSESFSSFADITSDMENWMSQLPPKLKNIPIVYLAIPGSHDSASCTITRSSAIAPDSGILVRRLGKLFGPVVKRIIYNWVITQHIHITEQLNHGIRYLDLRVATKPGSSDIFLIHGLYGSEVTEQLQHIKSFLDSHSGEIIILDFQHFYDFTSHNHMQLMSILDTLFGPKMCPAPHSVKSVTLSWMRYNRYQIIIIYRNPAGLNIPHLWPSILWPTPWPQTTSTAEMLSFLSQHLQHRPANAGFVSQGVLTPNTTLVILHPFSTLEDKCGRPCNKAILPWIERQIPGRGGINVVISDFINMPDIHFSKTVVQLNLKYLQEELSVYVK